MLSRIPQSKKHSIEKNLGEDTGWLSTTAPIERHTPALFGMWSKILAHKLSPKSNIVVLHSQNTMLVFLKQHLTSTLKKFLETPISFPFVPILNIVLISCKPALSFISVCLQSISCTCQANGQSYSPLWFMFFYRLRFF